MRSSDEFVRQNTKPSLLPIRLLYQKQQISYAKKLFENAVCKVAAILSRLQYIIVSRHSLLHVYVTVTKKFVHINCFQNIL